MSEQKSSTSTLGARIRRRTLAHGESIAIPVGLVLGALLVAILGASSWWTLHIHRESLERGRQEQVRTVAHLLAESIESMLVSNDVSGVRCVLSDAQLNYDLSRCRVTLPGGGILAEGEHSAITLKGALPEEWPAGQLPEQRDAQDAGSITLVMPLTVPGRGAAALEVAANISYPLWGGARVQAGIAIIALAGMTGLLAAYHAMRSRLRALGAIRDALRAAKAGPDAGAASLKVSAAFGAEAAAWNDLLAERDRLREDNLLRGVEHTSASGEHDAELTSACDAMWHGLLLVDDKLAIRYANGAAAVFFGQRAGSMGGLDFAEIIDNESAAAALASVAAGRSRQRTMVEVKRHSPGGAVSVLRLSIRPVRREDSGAAVVIVEDVTQQRIADESRNAFVAQATHELRTPLTNIRLYVETMVEDGENDPAVRAKCLNVIGQESRRLERIVGDMLSVSEIEAGSLKLRKGDIRLDALMEELHDDFRPHAEDKEMKLIFQLPPKLPVIQGDRDKLALALHNLLGNALKYTPAGGVVTLRAREEGPLFCVDVIDNGIGIKEEECELIFEKFYRAKDKRLNNITGSGLGLALARDVARMHGGDITVKSQIDKGSTFTLTVPITESVPVSKAA